MKKIVIKLEELGEERKYDAPLTVAEVLKEFEECLAEPPIAAMMNDNPVDLPRELTESCELSFISPLSDEGRRIYWHSTSHVMAKAVKELFPDVKLGIGPSIADGFYYDFDVKQPFTPEDLRRVEKKMQQLVKQNLPFRKEESDTQKAISLL